MKYYWTSVVFRGLKKWWQSDGSNLWKTGLEFSKIMSCDDKKIPTLVCCGFAAKLLYWMKLIIPVVFKWKKMPFLLGGSSSTGILSVIVGF